MTNWFYYNKKGEKISVPGVELRWLADNGKITPETIIEDPNGKSAPARNLKRFLSFCTNCGIHVAKRQGVCKSCGAKPTGHRKYCRHCGTAINPEQVICVKCNASIVNNIEFQGAWAVLVLIAGIVFGVFAILYGKDPFMMWCGIIVIVSAVANFLLALVKMLKK